MPTPYRHPKTGIYWIKGTIPPDVAQRMGKKQYRRSLAASSHSDVKAAYARVMLALEAEWEAVRHGPQTLTMRQLTALAGETYASFMQRFGDDPGPAPWPAIAALMDHATGPDAQITFEHSALGQALKAKGIPAVENTPAAHAALSRATAQAARQLARHAEGDFTPDARSARFPPWPAPATTAPAAFSFTDAVDLWARLSQSAPATVKAFRSMWTRMGTFLGHTDMARLSLADVRRWRDHLAEQGHDAGYIRESYMAAIHAVANLAVSEERLAANPATGIKVHGGKTKREKKRHFSPEEISTILSATFDPPPARLTATHKAARRWVPWLCAYTGARVGEMTQLRKEDIRPIEGIPCIIIDPAAGSQKTGSKWAIPIHAHLIEQGFLTFTDKAKRGPLFTDPSNKRVLTGEEKHLHKSRAEKLGAWVRSLGVTATDIQPNHGWRHTFKTKARGMKPKMDAEIRDYIQCHAPRTEGDGYGTWPIDSIKAELDRFPRYDISPPTEALGSPQTAKGGNQLDA